MVYLNSTPAYLGTKIDLFLRYHCGINYLYIADKPEMGTNLSDRQQKNKNMISKYILHPINECFRPNYICIVYFADKIDILLQHRLRLSTPKAL